MTSSRPYIMRALYEWIVDNDCTPYVLVDASGDGVMVPQQFVKDDQSVLNISPGAVMDLNISNDAVVFNGRFGGVATDGHRWEPVQPDGPLVTLSREPTANVVLTPQTAQGYLQLTAQMRAPEFTNIANLLAGRPLRHRVV